MIAVLRFKDVSVAPMFSSSHLTSEILKVGDPPNVCSDLIELVGPLGGCTTKFLNITNTCPNLDDSFLETKANVGLYLPTKGAINISGDLMAD
jgi:hypothetical protein